MSTKVSKVSKTSTKSVPAKAVSKVEKQLTKAPILRLSDEDKKADTLNYIYNSNTNKYVKRDTSLGKKLVKAEQSGEDIPKTMTETERLILVVKTIVDHLSLKDSDVKNALKPIISNLPRGFPVVWGGKQKNTRLPEHPKQPSNAYIFFTKAMRQKVSDQNPGVSNTQLVSLMAKMWKDTSEENRVEYYKLAEEDKKRYEEEMTVFEAEHPDQARAKSSPGKPTKATAYHKYCEENRDIVKTEHPELDGKAVTKLLADQWEEVRKDDAKFAKYQNLADEANEGFEERIADYHESNSPKKLSDSEKAKANDPENYELNCKTGRYVRKEQKKAPSPKVVAKESKKAPSPKVVAKESKKAVSLKVVAKEPEQEPEQKPKKVTRPKSKSKTVAEELKNDEIQVEELSNEEFSNDEIQVEEKLENVEQANTDELLCE